MLLASSALELPEAYVFILSSSFSELIESLSISTSSSIALSDESRLFLIYSGIVIYWHLFGVIKEPESATGCSEPFEAAALENESSSLRKLGEKFESRLRSFVRDLRLEPAFELILMGVHV